jgi:aminopeptidase
MRAGETLRINGGVHAQELVEETALLAMKQGVQVSITTVSDDFQKRVYEDVPVRYLKKTSKIAMKIADVVDNIITIEAPKDPRIMENIEHGKMAASVAANIPIKKKLDRRYVKWVFVGYPTQELADSLGTSYKKLERFIFSGILINEKKLREKAEKIMRKMQGADKIRVWDEYGTDMLLKLKNRRINMDDGYISDRDIKHKDVGSNLPAGEVFTAPVETYGSGTWVSPARRDLFTQKMIEGIRLSFKDGKLVKAEAEKNENVMKDTIRRCVAIDRNEKIIRTTNVAELGIGLNPVITDIIGYLLTDEKIGGTAHLAIGHNKGYGGTSESSLHWDFITNKGVNIEIVDDETIIENGKVI